MEPDRNTASRVATSQQDRAHTMQSLNGLEDALAKPSPGRERAWIAGVLDTLDAFANALQAQLTSTDSGDSLLATIAFDTPRLSYRVDGLRRELGDLVIAAISLREQVALPDGEDVDIADVRDRLATLAGSYRRHRAREADLVYEAMAVDLGVGD